MKKHVVAIIVGLLAMAWLTVGTAWAKGNKTTADLMFIVVVSSGFLVLAGLLWRRLANYAKLHSDITSLPDQNP